MSEEIGSMFVSNVQMYHFRFNKKAIFPLLLLLLLYVFMHIAHEVIVEKDNFIDSSAQNFILKHRTEALTNFFKWVTIFGSSYFLLPAYIIIVVYQLFHNRYRALFIAVMGLISFATLRGAKAFYHRTRPTIQLIDPGDPYSFPSGHSLSTMVFWGLMIYLIYHANLKYSVRITIIVFLILICLLVGASRVYLGVHFASDVLAGYCLGIFFLVIAYNLLLRHDSKVKLAK